MSLKTDSIVSIVVAVIAFIVMTALFGSLIGIGSAVLAYLFGTEIATFVKANYDALLAKLKK